LSKLRVTKIRDFIGGWAVSALGTGSMHRGVGVQVGRGHGGALGDKDRGR